MVSKLIDLDLTAPKVGNEDLERWLEENMLRLQKQINEFPSYGGMSGSDATFNLGAGWTKFEGFDTLTIDPPKNVEIDLVNNRIRSLTEGIFLLATGFAYEHNEQNQGRTFYVRLYNETDLVGGNSLPVGVARNVGVTNWGVVYQIEVDGGDWFSLQLGNGDTFTSGNIVDLELSISRIG